MKAQVEGQWANQYAFDLLPQEWIDFAPANYLNSTHLDAIFVQKLLVVKHNGVGRKTLFGDSVKIVANGSTEERTISPDVREAVLPHEFGLAAVND